MHSCTSYRNPIVPTWKNFLSSRAGRRLSRNFALDEICLVRNLPAMKRKLSAFAEKTLRENDAIRTREIAQLVHQHEKALKEMGEVTNLRVYQATSDAKRYEGYWQEEITLRKKHEEECHELRQSEREMLRRISQVMGELHQLRGAIVEYALTLGHAATSEDKARIIELQQKISGTEYQRTAIEATRTGSPGPDMASALRSFHE